MNTRINPQVVKAQIASLLSEHPELQNDEEGLLLSLDSETDAIVLLEQLVRRVGETKAHVNGVESYISEMRGRVDMLDRRIEVYRALMLKIMETANLSKVPLTNATVSISHKPASVIVTDRDQIPSEFRRIPPWEPDKMPIARSLKAGILVPGCALSNQEPTVTIRTK